MVENAQSVSKKHPEEIFRGFSFLLPAAFAVGAWVAAMRVPGLVDWPEFIAAQLIPLILALGVVVSVLFFRSKLHPNLEKNADGILVAACFFIGYLAIAGTFNQLGLNTNNILFAADAGSWQERLTGDRLELYGLRAVHPIAYLILRPLVYILSILTLGNRFYAGLVLLSLTGATSVFTTWLLIRKLTDSPMYALQVACLLGFSAAHLVFTAVFESYIFSAFSLILFCLLMVKEAKLPILALAGTLTLGITITNFAQNAIQFFFVEKKIKTLVILCIMVLTLGALGNGLNNLVYGQNEYFFLPGNLSQESRFAAPLSMERMNLLAQEMFVYSVAAPLPRLRGQGLDLRLNFDKNSFYDYPQGMVVLAAWVSLLGLAAFQFGRNFSTQNKITLLSLGMIFSLLFNLAIHSIYGFEPFLYAADWTYALVIFTGINLQYYARQTWFRFFFSGFLGIMLLNNGWFIYFIMHILAKNL